MGSLGGIRDMLESGWGSDLGKFTRVVYPKNTFHALGVAERFAIYANAHEADVCWEWLGARSNKNYGMISVNGRKRYAHRISWELANGAIPPDMVVCHRCDNPPCVNPAHLWVGTMQDNSRDMAVKGRSRNRPRYGRDNNKTKLSDDEVSEIRARWAAGERNKTLLAAEFGVDRSRIYQLIHHKDRR